MECYTMQNKEINKRNYSATPSQPEIRILIWFNLTCWGANVINSSRGKYQDNLDPVIALQGLTTAHFLVLNHSD